MQSVDTLRRPPQRVLYPICIHYSSLCPQWRRWLSSLSRHCACPPPRPPLPHCSLPACTFHHYYFVSPEPSVNAIVVKSGALSDRILEYHRLYHLHLSSMISTEVCTSRLSSDRARYTRPRPYLRFVISRCTSSQSTSEYHRHIFVTSHHHEFDSHPHESDAGPRS